LLFNAVQKEHAIFTAQMRQGRQNHRQQHFNIRQGDSRCLRIYHHNATIPKTPKAEKTLFEVLKWLLSTEFSLQNIHQSTL
jgi:hypothetical protein